MYVYFNVFGIHSVKHATNIYNLFSLQVRVQFHCSNCKNDIVNCLLSCLKYVVEIECDWNYLIDIPTLFISLGKNLTMFIENKFS